MLPLEKQNKAVDFSTALSYITDFESASSDHAPGGHSNIKSPILPDIHDFSTTDLYQQATQILHSSQTFSIEEEAPNEFAGLFQTEKELLQIRLQLDDDLTIQSILSSASGAWIRSYVFAVLIAADAMRSYGVSDWDTICASASFIS